MLCCNQVAEVQGYFQCCISESGSDADWSVVCELIMTSGLTYSIIFDLFVTSELASASAADAWSGCYSLDLLV
jgi:hypothetical protein